MAYSNHVYPDHASPSKEKNGILSQVKIGDIVYLLKDNEARAALDAEFKKLTAAAYTEVGNDKTEIKSDGAKLLTGKAVYDYIVESLQDTVKGVVFRGVATAKPEGPTVTIKGESEAQNSTLTAKTGDMVIFGIKEYVYDGSKWIELGDETLYLTPDSAANTYVAKTFEIAGIAMNANIEAKGLAKALAAENKTALGLGEMAYADTASVNIETVDSATVDAATAGSYNVTGQDTVNVPTSIDPVTIPTVASINVGKEKGAAVKYSKPSTLSAKGEKAVADSKPANYTPAGKVTLPNLSTSVTAATDSFKVGATDGEAYKLATPGGVTHEDDQIGDAVNASVSGEILTLSAVKPVTAVGAIKYTAPTLTGSLPTFTNKTLATGISTASVSYAADKSKTEVDLAGEPAHLSASVATWDNEAAATVTDATYTATPVAGTDTVTPVFNKKMAEAAAVGGSINVTGGSKTVNLVKTPKSPVVSPAKKQA